MGQRKMHPLSILCFLTGAFGVLAASAAPVKTIHVWVDDAHTRRIAVPELDADEIAESSRISLGIGLGLGDFGISLGWERERGVEYDEAAESLIEKIRELCEEFNEEEMSLETYHRRIREIYEAEEIARRFRMELLMRIAQDAQGKFVEMDELYGEKTQDIRDIQLTVEEALASFDRSVGSILCAEEISLPASNPSELEETARDCWMRMQGATRLALSSTLEELEECVKRDPPKPRREKTMITIWKDYERTQRITVPKLDVTSIVRDVEESVSMGARYSQLFVSFDVGPRACWAVERAADYDEAAQLLILKYKQLCLEYNSGLVCQEAYADRLQELFEAEDRARDARHQFGLMLKEQADAALADMDSRLASMGSSPSSDWEKSMEAMSGEMRQSWNELRKSKQPPSLVERISRGHREEMVAASLGRFSESLMKVEPGEEKDLIEVWVDEERKQKVKTPRLDPDLLAQTTQNRLTLHFSWFNFGPEIVWARKKGVEYDHRAQLLIIKYKQLIMEYNAGLVSQEAFEARRREIDEALEMAAQVRQRMTNLAFMFKRGAFEEMDRRFEQMNR